MKQNDWIVASINNPTYDAQDFQYISDMTLANTQLLPKEDYLKSQFIRDNDKFKDSNGNFSEDIFNTFYANAAESFQDFSAENEINEYQYSMWDTLRPKDGKVKDLNFNLSKEVNPQHLSVGISGINEVSFSDKSMRELAQNSKIYDPATGKYLDKSVNDISLFSSPVEYFQSIFGDPLVYATYDEDTEEIDPNTGNKVLHKKGEWKVNEQGEYYVEKLNGRSLIGKQVVSAMDYLTPEDTQINKYDFFDSDDLEKSVGGTVAKNVAAILPLLNPYVGLAYSGLLVGREISKSLPMLYGMVNGLLGTDNTDSKLLNTIAAYGQTFTGGSSDYAQQNTFSFENFASLMSDVALQWGQQKFIAQTFSKLTSGGERALQSAYAKAQAEYVNKAEQAINDVFDRKIDIDQLKYYVGSNNITQIQELIGSGEWVSTAFGKAVLNKYVPKAQKVLESRTRIGQDLSLVYMAMISNTDVYETVLEKGGTPFEAASIALGSMIGMFSVDKYLGLGEMFFNDGPARKAIRDSAKKSVSDLMDAAGFKEGETQTKKGIIGLIQSGINSGKKAVQNYRGAIKDRTLGFVGKSLGEGLEEVSEELVADLSKTLGELAGKLGYFSQTDYGAGENIFERYAMSFLGGAAGGGLFYGIDVVQNRNKQTQEFQNDLVYLLRQGKKDEILAELSRLRKEGKMGSKNLSYKTTQQGDQTVFLTAQSEKDSQSQYIYDTLVKAINQLDFIINDNYINLSEDEVFDKMVQGEYRQQALSDFLKGNKDDIKDISYITNYQQDFQKVAQDIVKKEVEIQDYINSTPDVEKRSNTEFQEKLNRLKQERQQLIDYKEYLFGEGSLGYVEKMLFAMDTKLSKEFLALTYDEFVKNKYNKLVSELTESEKQNSKKVWEEQQKNKKNDLDEAFRLYKDLEGKINPSVQDISDNVSDWYSSAQSFIEQINNVPIIDYNTKLEDETDEDYQNRAKQLEGESDKDYEKRIKDREKRIQQLQNNAIAEWINTIASMQLDRNQFRTIQSQIQLLKKNRLQGITRTFQIQNNPELTHKIWSLLEQSDFSNTNSLKQSIRRLVQSDIQNQVELDYAGRTMFYDLIWDQFKEKLTELGEPVQGYLTYGDMYKLFENAKKEYESNGQPFDPEQYLLQLSEGEFIVNPDSTDKQEQANADLIQWYSLAIMDNKIRQSKWDTPIEVTENYIRHQIKSQVNDLFMGKKINPQEEKRDKKNGLNSRLNEIFKAIDKDPLLQSLTNLENKAFSVNPVVNVVNTISKISSNSNIDINEFLEGIYSQYQNGDNAQSFQLTEQQEKVLMQFIKDLQMSQAFIHAASISTNYQNPIGHNKAINQFISNHKSVYNTDQVLPEIDSEYANFLLNEIQSFIKESVNWIELSRINTSNKTRKFTTAENKYVNAVSEFYKINRDSFKLSQGIDLLEGYETIGNTATPLGVAQVSQLLHNNYLKAKAKGITIEQILDELLPKVTNMKELATQLTSKLDDNLEYSKLTSYDKLSLIISSFSISPKRFYSELLQFIQDNGNIAPLSIQEEVSKIVLAQQSDPELINQVLKYLSTELKVALPILENTAIVLGLGGAGKSAVIAKIGASDGTNSWICGPVQNQIDNLSQYLPKGVGKTKDDLLTAALGSERYAEFRNAFQKGNDGKWKIDSRYGSIVPGLDGTKTFKVNDNFEVNKITDAPKLIVIDEATHFNTAELQIISKFAKLNNIQVLLLGDDHQNGYVQNGLMMNLDRESCLSWRTPKLFLSLRDNNVQKSNNLLSIINLIDQLDNSFNVGNEETIAEEILTKVIPNFGFNYYNKETFKGELITKELPSDMVSKLSGSIGFIGASTSENYKKLQEAGKNPVLVDPLAVQGQEFDYVIVDKDWKLKEDNPASLYFFLRDLYTMISRSRNGTILIDKGSLNIFHSIENELTGTTSMKSAINLFREQRIPVIKEIVDKLVEEEVKDQTDDQTGNDKSDDSKNDGKIEGTNIDQSNLDPEPEPIIDNSEFNQEETDNSQKQDEDTVETINTPIRCYSNVSYSGIPLKEIWTNNNNIKKDLGIFVREGDIIRDGSDKREIVRQLLQLKCIFNYGTQYFNALPIDIQRRFSKQSFDDAKYYIQVEDPSDNNKLIGLTDLDPDKRTINGKVVTLVASFKDKKGETWELTLGGLANPQTWKDNEAEITRRIQKRIDENDPKSESLKEYLKDLHKNIVLYENKIAELTKTNQKYRINTPQFSGLTTLIKSDTELRLQSIDPDSNAQPFNAACQYALKSDVYVLTEDIPGVNLEVKGKPVMYVSSNLLLDPSQLEAIYRQQKNDPTLVPQVRMIVLDNMGVSFDSLYRKKYQDIYTTAQGETKYYFPMESEPTGLRMYIAMWNFRANLKNFLRAYNIFKEDSKLSQEDIIKLCQLDNSTYQAIRGDQDYLSEQEYRSKVDEKTKALLKPIWDFNDSLKDYRQFRLGYSSKNGAYLRKLTNLSEDGPYSGTNLNDIIGIYINPDLAEQYSQVLDNLFNNILEKIVPTDGRDPLTYINKELEKGWFSKAIKDRKISIDIVDYSENLKGTIKTGSLNFEQDQSLAAILPIMTETAKFLEIKATHQIEFEEYLQQNPDKYKIKFGDEDLNWWGIDQVFEKDRPTYDTDKSYDYTQFAPGINPYEIDKDTNSPIGIIDERVSNLFSLMFHGLTSTKKYNDFTKDEIRATDANFKYGLFVDPVLAPKQGSSNTNALVITNKRLFGAKVYPGLPIIGVSLEQYEDQQSNPPSPVNVEVDQDQNSQGNNTPQQSSNILDQMITDSGIKLLRSNHISFSQDELEDINNVNDLKELVKSKIINRFKKFWNTQSSDINEIKQIPYSAELEQSGKLVILTLGDMIINRSKTPITIEEAHWELGNLVVKQSDGNSIIISSSPYGAIFTPAQDASTPSVEDTNIIDLGIALKNIIEKYTYPNNQDGLDEYTSKQITKNIDTLIKKGLQAEDVSMETKSRIINQVQKALKYTNLEDEAITALGELKKICEIK